MHIALSRNTHNIRLLPTDDIQPIQCVCKIPCSTLVVGVDATYKKLFLMDMSLVNTEMTEIAGYELNDLVIHSIPLFDPSVDSKFAMCGGLACDETGHTVYALMLDKPKAYIRLYRMLNRTLSHLYQTWEIPYDDGITEYVDEHINTTTDEICPARIRNNFKSSTPCSICHTNITKVGTLDYISHTTPGSGLAYKNGKLYAMTWRKMKAEHYYNLDVDMLCNFNTKVGMQYCQPTKFMENKVKLNEHLYPNDNIWTERAEFDNKYEENLAEIIRQEDYDLDDLYEGIYSGILWNHPEINFRRLIFRVRYAEIAASDYWITTLHTINSENGSIVAINSLSEPRIDNNALFHGITAYDDVLLVGKRWDDLHIPTDWKKWHVEKMSYNKNSMIDYTGPIMICIHPLAELYWDNAAAEERQPPPTLCDYNIKHGYVDYEAPVPFSKIYDYYRYIFKPNGLMLRELYDEVMKARKLYWSISSRKLLPSISRETRGPSEVAVVNIPDNKTNGQFLPSTPLYKEFPFDIVLPNCLTSDDSERKMFAVLGSEIWTFDALDCTIVVQYDNGIAEGDIIDFGDIMDGLSRELTCFIRNDSNTLLTNVILEVQLSEENWRTDDIFLVNPPATEGYKRIEIGDIIAGGSKEFKVRAYSINVQSWETQRTYRVPLRVHYKRYEHW